jgi:hypothetical protein
LFNFCIKRNVTITEYNFECSPQIVNREFQEGFLGEEGVLRGDIDLKTGMLPLHPASHPELMAPYGLHFPVLRAIQIRLRGPDVGMAHQNMNPL